MYHCLITRQKTFKRISGVSKATFDEMIHIVSEYRKNQANKLIWKQRCGRNNALCLEDQIFLCLMYMRSYTSYLFLWSIFWVSETTAWRVQRDIENILIRSKIFSLPKKTLLQEEIEEVLIDATESQIERPKKWQRDFYSGKKKRHTLKTQVVRDRWWKILRIHITQGKTHDKKLYDNSDLHIHKNTKKRMDSWYQWVQQKESNVIIPQKSSKKHPLTKEEKQENREKSKLRIPVEHTMGRIKQFKITAHPYRNRRKRFWLRMNLICWILNYELEVSQKNSLTGVLSV